MSARTSILVLNRWPQYPGGERWDNGLARYDDLIPHDLYRVTYVCDSSGQRGVPDGVHDVHPIHDFADVDEVIGVVGKLIAHNGPFHHIVAFSEYLLDVAALIRERYGIAGPWPPEIDRFRDKTVMKAVLQEAGIRVPRWFACESGDQFIHCARSLGFPVILKPRRGASSQGVMKVKNEAELASICRGQPLDSYEIEEFIEGDLLHADGVVDRNGKCLFMAVSRYISSCLDFEAGLPLGSIIQTDAGVRARSKEFAVRVLAALDLKSSAFHLEFFDTRRDLVFLEIGARVPGADVSYVIHDVYGVNLFRLWVDVLLGRDAAPVSSEGVLSGGWLMIPRPKPEPQVVIHSTPLVGRIPFLYRELVPRPGQSLEQAAGYASLQGGRFLFRGGSQSEIVAAVRAAESEYRLTTAIG